MKLLFALFSLLFLIPSTQALILSEIMYDPIDNENYNEWIELFNDEEDLIIENITLCGDEILKGYVDKNGSIKKDNVDILKKDSYALITDGGSGTEVYQNNEISDNTVSLHVKTSSLCKGLSNSGKTISINYLNQNKNITYSAFAKEGYSLEEVNGEFKESLEIKGTPGEKNSNYLIKEEKTKETQKTIPKENITKTEEIKKELPLFISIYQAPYSSNFGKKEIVKATITSDKNYPELLFYLYSDQGIVVDHNNFSIDKDFKSYLTAVKLKAYKQKRTDFSLPLIIHSNCDNSYPEKEYKIYLKGYTFNKTWKQLTNASNFTLFLFNNPNCFKEKVINETLKSVDYGDNFSNIRKIGLVVSIILTFILFFIIWKKYS